MLKINIQFIFVECFLKIVEQNFGSDEVLLNLWLESLNEIDHEHSRIQPAVGQSI